MQQHNWHTSGLHMFELIPIEGNELVCKLITYKWKNQGWAFASLEAVFFKDANAKKEYVKDLVKKYNRD